MTDGALITPQNPPAGWYDDPDGTQRQRWFDGNNWADHYQSPDAAVPVYIVRPPSDNLLALASVIIPLLTFLLSITFMGAARLAFLPATVALIFGFVGLNTAKNNGGLRRKPAIWGIALSGIMLILSVVAIAGALR